jgi:hyperosmotically inducible periplasmic protein
MLNLERQLPEESSMKLLGILSLAALMMLSTVACNQKNDVSYKDSVEKSLTAADLKDVSVSEDAEKNTITLSGTLHSDDAKQQAAQVAQNAAGSRIVVNEISVQPVGAESEAKEIASNLDDGIENNYKAALVAHGLDKQSIDYSVKNGVLTLTGKVKTPGQRQEAERAAAQVPNVAQVVNELEVRR